MSRPRIVCYGDSITQLGHDPDGWLGLIQSKYCRSLDIINRGFSGYNTKWLLEHFDEIELDFKNAKIVFILMGANDAADDQQFVPVCKFKENLTELGTRIMKLAEKVVLIGTPWVNGQHWLQFSNEKYGSNDTEPNRSADQAKKYSKAGMIFLKKSYKNLIVTYLFLVARQSKFNIFWPQG